MGLGLDAYVAVGTRVDSSGVESGHAWVVTRERADPSRYSGPPADEAFQAIFWEPVSGVRSSPSDVSPTGYRYARIHCLFNDSRYFANHRLDDRIEAASWDFLDLAAWKPVRAIRV